MHYALPIDVYVQIGVDVTELTGDFQEQYKYLSLLPVGYKAWSDRAKVRNLIFLSHFEAAELLIDDLLSKNANLYIDFAARVLWQLGRRNRLSRLSVIPKIISDNLSYGIRMNDIPHSKQSAAIYSLYVNLTSHQIEMQKYCVGGISDQIINITPKMGIMLDRMPSSALAIIGGIDAPVGVVGASAGHIKILEDFLRTSKSYCIVTESDSFITRPIAFEYFDKIFNESTFDFILCSDRHCDFNITPVSDIVMPINYNGRASGFDGYMISRKCAGDLVEKMLPPWDRHIDGRVIDWLIKNGYRVGFTASPIFAQSINSTFSVRAAIELNY